LISLREIEKHVTRN